MAYKSKYTGSEIDAALERALSTEGLSTWQKSYLEKAESDERSGKFSVSASLSGVGSEFTGEAAAYTLTAQVRYDGAGVTGASVTASGAASGAMTEASAGVYRTSFTSAAPASTNGRVTVSASASAVYNDGYGELTKTASASHTRYAATYYVLTDTADTPQDEAVTAGTKKVLTTLSGSHTVTGCAGKYVWIVYPSCLSLAKITSGGFEVPRLEAVSLTLTLGESAVSYLAVRIEGRPQSDMSITIS